MQAWYVIYTKPQKEAVAHLNLRLRGVEAFFPRLLLPKFSRRQKPVVPLFPNYLFVRVDFEKAYDAVRWTPGVKCFVSFNDNPTPLEDGVAEYLLNRADLNGIIVARPDLKRGQEVRICGGPFEGILGFIDQIADAKGRVKILMELLSRKMTVDVPLRVVETGWIMG